MSIILDTAERAAEPMEDNEIDDTREIKLSTSIKDLWGITTVPEITVSLFFLKFVRYGEFGITTTQLYN